MLGRRVVHLGSVGQQGNNSDGWREVEYLLGGGHGSTKMVTTPSGELFCGILLLNSANFYSQQHRFIEQLVLLCFALLLSLRHKLSKILSVCHGSL